MAIRWKTAPQDDPLIAEINTTPLVDVMLVLLIIFLITVPVVNSSIAVSLPRDPGLARDASQESVLITVDAQGAVYWFDTRLTDHASLQELLNLVASMNPQPEVHIRGDARAEYAPVGRVVHASQQAGIARIGFVTEPPGSR